MIVEAKQVNKKYNTKFPRLIDNYQKIITIQKFECYQKFHAYNNSLHDSIFQHNVQYFNTSDAWSDCIFLAGLYFDLGRHCIFFCSLPAQSKNPFSKQFRHHRSNCASTHSKPPRLNVQYGVYFHVNYIFPFKY